MFNEEDRIPLFVMSRLSLCYVYQKIKLAILRHLLVYRVVKNHGPHVHRVEIKKREYLTAITIF